jgi:hypothetical protein
LRRIRQFAALPTEERWLLLRAAVLVAAVRLALWRLPFHFVRQYFAAPRRISPGLAGIRVKRLAWAVQAAARRIPAASCLTQALALRHLLARAGKDSVVRIGVSLDRGGDAAGRFESHAWLEHRGQIILGGEVLDNGQGNGGGLERYTPMLAFPEAVSAKEIYVP